MRVGHLIKGLGRGGAEMLLPHLIESMGDRADSSVAYFLPWKDALVRQIEECGAPVTCIEAHSNPVLLAKVPRVRDWIRRRRLDLVHAHLPVSGAAGRLAARLEGVPLVYTEHNLQERYRVPTRWLNRATWTLQDHVVAVSDEVRRSIESALPRRVPVTVVTNGIPAFAAPGDGQARAAARAALGLEEGLTVGTVAVFRTQKRLDHWLAAARRIADEVPGARFVIVGDGPERERVETEIARLDLADRVTLPGLQEEIPDWLAAMDVFLIASEFEGLPLALLEGMMAGLPVVSTRVGGIPEVVRDGESGFLVPFGDVPRLADRAVALLKDGTLRDRIGAAARRAVIAEHGIDRMAERLLGIYEATLTASR